MKKTELLERVRAAHERLTRALDGLTEEEASRTGLTAEWSVKDALAHIIAWEQTGAEALEGMLAGTYEPRRFDKESIDRFNAGATAERRGRTLGELSEEFGAAHRRMTGVLGRLPEEVEESTPAYKFAEGVTFRHFAHHAEQIEKFRQSNTREP